MNRSLVRTKGWMSRLVLLSAAALAACDSPLPPDTDSDAPDDRPVLTAAIVSNPVTSVADASGAAGIALSRTATGGLVYVSLPPGSIPDGKQATLSSPRSGGALTVPMVDGGFDPVAVEADAGDTLALDVRITDADQPLRYAMVVPARVPPVVVRTDPPPKKRDVPLNATMLIVFSEPIDPATLTDSSVQVMLGDSPIVGSLVPADSAMLTARFTPTAPLVAGTDYVLVVTRAIEDLDGTPLEASVAVEFETESQPPPSTSWASLPSMPEPRWQAGAAAVDGVIYVAGGVADRGAGWLASPSILAFDPVSNTWRVVGTLLQAVRAPAMAVVGSRIYVIGGFLDDPWRTVGTVQVFDPTTGTVDSGPSMPTPRGALAVTVLDGHVHAIGGVVSTFDSTTGDWDSSHEVFDPATGTWSSRTPMPQPRGGHGAVAIDGRIYVAGGIGDTLQVYDPATDAWSLYPAPPARFDPAAVTLDGMLFIIGGSEYRTECCGGPIPSTAVDRFDPATGRWEQVVSMPTARTGLAAVVAAGAVYVVGGSASGGATGALSVTERFMPSR